MKACVTAAEFTTAGFGDGRECSAYCCPCVTYVPTPIYVGGDE